MSKLTPRDQRFVEEYLIDLDPKRAALEAGYSKTVAASKAYQWVSNGKTKPHVYAAVIEKAAARSKRTEITADNVLREIAVLAFTDMATYLRLEPDGKIALDWSNLPEGATKAISEIQQESTTFSGKDGGAPVVVTKTKFKLYDKRAALVDLGRHLKLFTDKVEHDASDALAEVLRLVAERPRPSLPSHANGQDRSA